MVESASTIQKVTVKSVRRIQLNEPVPVYDATVPEHHNFCLGNGAVVHNTAKNARDSDYQEVFKLRGKLTNASRADITKLMKSPVIQDMLIAYGVDLRSLNLEAESLGEMKFSSENLRIGIVNILADADTDGGHICVLLLSAIWRLMPTLITEGRVFIVRTPLFIAKYKNKLYGGMTLEECRKSLPKGASASDITRAKGLGEINATDLRECAFNPETRKLYQVKPPGDGDALAYFMAITGSNTAARKELLGL